MRFLLASRADELHPKAALLYPARSGVPDRTRQPSNNEPPSCRAKRLTKREDNSVDIRTIRDPWRRKRLVREVGCDYGDSVSVDKGPPPREDRVGPPAAQESSRISVRAPLAPSSQIYERDAIRSSDSRRRAPENEPLGRGTLRGTNISASAFRASRLNASRR